MNDVETHKGEDPMAATPAFRLERLLWIKCVTDPDRAAYLDEDRTALHEIPARPGDEFDLHCAEIAASSLGQVAIGDLVALTQHGYLTHVVEIVGPRVIPRPAGTIRRRTRDAHFCFQRRCRALLLANDLDSAPPTKTALGFAFDVRGGNVLPIDGLVAFRDSGLSLAEVQARVVEKLRARAR